MEYGLVTSYSLRSGLGRQLVGGRGGEFGGRGVYVLALSQPKMNISVPLSCIHSVNKKNTAFKIITTFIRSTLRIGLVTDREIPIGLHVKTIGTVQACNKNFPRSIGFVTIYDI